MVSKYTIHNPAKRVIIGCAIVIFLVLVFELLVHPFVAFLFFNGIEHEGLDIYTSKQYLEYYGGEVFHDKLIMCGFIAECETTGFYHVNNWPKDNLFYGKACDIFCLELDAIDKYSSIKSTICTQSQKILTQGDWSIYLLTQPTAKNTENHFFIATNDKNKFIRCLLIMDYKGDITLDFRSLFVRYSSLEW